MIWSGESTDDVKTNATEGNLRATPTNNNNNNNNEIRKGWVGGRQWSETTLWV